MLDHAHAGDAAVDVDPDEQVNAAAVAVRRDRVEDRRDRLTRAPSTVDNSRRVAAEQLGGGHAQGVVRDVVVELGRRQQGVQVAQQHRALVGADRVAGRVLGNRDEGRAGDREQPEKQARQQDLTAADRDHESP